MKNMTHAATKNVVNAARSTRLTRMAIPVLSPNRRRSQPFPVFETTYASNVHQMLGFHSVQRTIHRIVARRPKFLPATSTAKTNIRHGDATDRL
ncbi:MAG: hypothetical protein WAM40_22250 [Xanthobacteraceae bacterium]